MSRTDRRNFLDEAKRLLELIDVSKVNKEEDYLFVQSIQNRVRLEAFVSDKQIFWLRDIKDRQLEKEE